MFGGAQTPLHMAATYNNDECVEYLVEKGADCDCIDIDGRTPLMCAVERGAVECASLLVRLGANVGMKSNRGEASSRAGEPEPWYGGA